MMVAWEGQAGKWGDGHLGELGLEELEGLEEFEGLEELEELERRFDVHLHSPRLWN